MVVALFIGLFSSSAFAEEITTATRDKLIAYQKQASLQKIQLEMFRLARSAELAKDYAFADLLEKLKKTLPAELQAAELEQKISEILLRNNEAEALNFLESLQ